MQQHKQLKQMNAGNRFLAQFIKTLKKEDKEDHLLKKLRPLSTLTLKLNVCPVAHFCLFLPFLSYATEISASRQHNVCTLGTPDRNQPFLGWVYSLSK
jgi:hypothetical protein